MKLTRIGMDIAKQARGSPSRLGLGHLAHSRSRIYGRNRTPHHIKQQAALASGLGPYMTDIERRLFRHSERRLPE